MDGEDQRRLFPGGELVVKGIADLRSDLETIESCLVAIGSWRLRRAGLDIPEHSYDLPEHRLYELLAAEDSDTAHGRYNALLGRLVSFERAWECVNTRT